MLYIRKTFEFMHGATLNRAIHTNYCYNEFFSILSYKKATREKVKQYQHTSFFEQ